MAAQKTKKIEILSGVSAHLTNDVSLGTNSHGILQSKTKNVKNNVFEFDL